MAKTTHESSLFLLWLPTQDGRHEAPLGRLAVGSLVITINFTLDEILAE